MTKNEFEIKYSKLIETTNNEKVKILLLRDKELICDRIWNNPFYPDILAKNFFFKLNQYLNGFLEKDEMIRIDYEIDQELIIK